MQKYSHDLSVPLESLCAACIKTEQPWDAISCGLLSFFK